MMANDRLKVGAPMQCNKRAPLSTQSNVDGGQIPTKFGKNVGMWEPDSTRRLKKKMKKAAKAAAHRARAGMEIKTLYKYMILPAGKRYDYTNLTGKLKRGARQKLESHKK